MSLELTLTQLSQQIGERNLDRTDHMAFAA
jgi:hypothetical protein